MTGVLTRSGGKVNLTRSAAMALPAPFSAQTRVRCFERRQRRCYPQWRSDLVGYRVDGLEPVAGDVGHHPLVRVDLARRGQLLQDANGHPTGRLGKDTLRTRQQSDA